MARKINKPKTTSRKHRSQATKKSPATTAVLTGRERNIQDFLKAAVKADPSTAAGKAALSAAQSAALRLARDLKRDATRAAGQAAVDLERRSNQALFRAVLAKELPRMVELLRRKRPVIENQPLPAPVTLVAPDPPTQVQAEAAVLSAKVRWTAPAQPVVNYRVIPTAAGVDGPFTVVAGTMTETTIVGLTATTSYTFKVIASTPPLGDSAPSAPSNAVTILGLPVPPPGGGAIAVTLPSFSSDPALLIDAEANRFKSFLGDATRIGQKWRYEHLKVQAIAAARESMLYEEHIARLMAMAIDKLGTAEQMLNATLLDAVGRGRNIIADQIKAASSPEFTDLLAPLGDTAAQALLLPKFFAFLVETGPIKFWIGLFEAIISDLAAVIPLFDGPTDFKRTRKYIRNIFNDPTNDVRKAVSAAAAELLARLDSDVEQMMAPLRAATAEVIAGTRQAMADVFEGFDVTLLMTPSNSAGAADVPDLDPLESLYQRLNAPIDELAAKVKGEIRPKLEQLLNGSLLKDDGNIFEAVVIAFLVLPILVFLVISLAGGPFSAALLAAVVLIAAEELLHLLVQWLAGPLLKKITELNETLNNLVGQLQAFFAQQAALARNESPELVLKILASQLRELRDFLPSAFLEETAGLLQEARNVVLRTATQLGLGAEQALGLENATAFEAINDDYATQLEQAPQLPGGRDPSRYAGAALLRDFGRLEEQRIGIRDGKEVEFTHRISLLRLLGGTITDFLQKRELVVSLTEQDLLDRMFPGIYRALIKEVRVTGILGGTIDPRICGIPLSITHLGPSSTRIKRSANPAAPPLGLPDCFPKTASEFSIQVVGTPPRILPPVGGLPDGPIVIFFGPEGPDALEAQIQAAFSTLTVKVSDYGTAFFIGLLLLLAGLIDDVQEFICSPLRKALLDNLLDSLERITLEKSCGYVDPAPIVSAARTLISTVRLGDIFASLVLPANANEVLGTIPNLDAGIPELAARFQLGFVSSNGTPVPGLVGVAQQAWNLALKGLLRRIAHWGDVDFLEDPDPQVRALGFVRMVRNLPPETMAFNLFQSGSSPTQIRTDSLTGSSSDGSPLGPSSILQYRLFENRGIEGDLLIRLESLDDDSLLPLPAGTLVKQLSTNLTDVILDVTFRGCYDPDLAQTVRSSRRQTAAGFNVASRIPGALGPLALPDSLVRTDLGNSEFRTVHYSMRAHRDKTLQVLTAAVAQPTPPAALLNLVTGKSVLGRDAAFEPLDPAATNFTFELNNQALPNTVAALQGLVTKLQISATDLAFDPSIISTGEGASAQLFRVGIAVIPMPAGVRGEDDEPNVDPINVQLQVIGLLGNVFPGFGASTPLPERLQMTVVDPADNPPIINPPSVADLFSAVVKPAFVFALDGALTGGSRLYDIIVSLTFKVPNLRVRTAINGLR